HGFGDARARGRGDDSSSAPRAARAADHRDLGRRIELEALSRNRRQDRRKTDPAETVYAPEAVAARQRRARQRRATGQAGIMLRRLSFSARLAALPWSWRDRT